MMTVGVCARVLTCARSVPRPPGASTRGEGTSIPLRWIAEKYQVCDRKVPASCQDWCGLLPYIMAQTEEAGAIVMWTQTQRRTRYVARQHDLGAFTQRRLGHPMCTSWTWCWPRARHMSWVFVLHAASPP